MLSIFRARHQMDAPLTRLSTSAVTVAGTQTLAHFLDGWSCKRELVVKGINHVKGLTRIQFQAHEFTGTGPLEFLAKWKPVVDDPDQQLRQLSPGGYDELYVVQYQPC